MHLELFQELRIHSNVSGKFEAKLVEWKVRVQNQRLLVALLSRVFERSVYERSRVTWFVRFDVETAGCYHSADCFQKLVAVFGEVATSGANGTVDSRVDLVVAVKFSRFGCLWGERLGVSRFE